MQTSHLSPTLTSTSLAQRQQQLLEKILLGDAAHCDAKDSPNAGLGVYRNNLHFTAARAVQVTYPVLAQLIGDNLTRQLAKQMLKVDPPTTGDWGDWGERLSEVIASTPLTTSHPYLPDIARLEWAMHQAGRSAVHAIDRDTLASIHADRLLQSTLVLCPGMQLVASEYPIDLVWHAHQTPGENSEPDANALAKAIQRHGSSCQLLVYQYHDRPQMIRLSSLEWQWISELATQAILTELLDRFPQMDFVNWLSRAIEHQWISNLLTPDQCTTRSN